MASSRFLSGEALPRRKGLSSLRVVNSKRLARILVVTFIFAVMMGAGPGVYLVNPDPGDPEARRFIGGIPIVYAWAVFWFAIQATCVVIAYRRLWRTGLAGGEGEEARPDP